MVGPHSLVTPISSHYSYACLNLFHTRHPDSTRAACYVCCLNCSSDQRAPFGLLAPRLLRASVERRLLMVLLMMVVNLLGLPVLVLGRLSTHIENHHLRTSYGVLGTNNGHRPAWHPRTLRARGRAIFPEQRTDGAHHLMPCHAMPLQHTELHKCTAKVINLCAQRTRCLQPFPRRNSHPFPFLVSSSTP